MKTELIGISSLTGDAIWSRMSVSGGERRMSLRLEKQKEKEKEEEKEEEKKK